jgi:hypothetical protein
LYDHEVKKIIQGPLEWFNARTGSLRVIDDVHKGLEEQFHKIGFKVDVQVWTLGECRCASSHHATQCPHLRPIEGAYQFDVVIQERIDPESGFDYERMSHEVQNNLLEIPGEGGKIKFDPAEFRRQHGQGGHHH